MNKLAFFLLASPFIYWLAIATFLKVLTVKEERTRMIAALIDGVFVLLFFWAFYFL